MEVNGDKCHPIYNFLRKTSSLHNPETGLTKQIPWNFAKFLINPAGVVVDLFGPNRPPSDMVENIDKLVEEKK